MMMSLPENPRKAGRKQSDLINFFTPVPKTGKVDRIKCQFCGIVICKNGTRMKIHLSTKCKTCPDIIKEKCILNDSDCDYQLSGNPGDMNMTGKKPKSQNVKSFRDKMSESEQIQACELLARAVYSSNLPLDIVENEHWQRALTFLRPTFRVPTAYEMTGLLLDKEHAHIMNCVAEAIAKANSVNIMSNGWSNTNKDSVMNILVNTPYPVLYRNMLLDVQNHTPAYMAQILTEVIIEIGPEKVFGIVTDNVNNTSEVRGMLKDRFNKENLFLYGSAANCLNLLMSDLIELPSLKTIVEKCNDVVMVVKNDKSLSLSLEKRSGIGLQKFTASRPSSIVNYFDSILKNMHSLQYLANDSKTQNVWQIHPQVKETILDQLFWEQLNDFNNFLEPIARIHAFVQTDELKISEMCTIFKELDDHFENYIVNLIKITESDKEVIKEKYAARKELTVYDIHKIANLLDPNKKGCDLTPEDKTVASAVIYEIGKKIPEINHQQIIAELGDFLAENGFFCHEFLKEAACYVNGMSWWQGFCKSTSLSQIAERVLSLPLSSPADAWKDFAHVKKVNRLDSEGSIKLMYISHNLKLQQSVRNVQKGRETEVAVLPAKDFENRERIVVKRENGDEGIMISCNEENESESISYPQVESVSSAESTLDFNPLDEPIMKKFKAEGE